VLEHGLTGFIVDSVAEAVEAVRLVSSLDRRAIRRRFEQRFTAERMARDYLTLYRRLPAFHPRPRRVA
jgi:glycosyltransferase involved in cell wall biosynthesis